eukprot:TRINITY_DN8472_c0_g3_i2.p4 TRINITY_DN8472_c0_g3~~TRINITY_DN8472_c0_g3_i2.p4  ORF type:complete len:106 (+),score=37.73 TRINITY_DN8472_c0_g3_i2:760-1077(+)
MLVLLGGGQGYTPGELCSGSSGGGASSNASSSGGNSGSCSGDNTGFGSSSNTGEEQSGEKGAHTWVASPRDIAVKCQQEHNESSQLRQYGALHRHISTSGPEARV